MCGLHEGVSIGTLKYVFGSSAWACNIQGMTEGYEEGRASSCVGCPPEISGTDPICEPSREPQVDCRLCVAMWNETETEALGECGQTEGDLSMGSRIQRVLSLPMPLRRQYDAH